MKWLSLFLLVIPITAFQPPTSPITATTVTPTGPCTANQGRLVGGVFYTCQNGTWGGAVGATGPSGPTGPTGATSVPSYSTVSSSATPTFTVVTGTAIQTFQFTMTQSVTSSTLDTTVATTGQILVFKICEDSTGGWTFMPPINVLNFGNINTTSNVCNNQSFVWDGTNAIGIGVMVPNSATPGFTTSLGFISLPTAPADLTPLASPVFTGTPKAPTQSPGDSTTALSTDAFVANAVAPLAPLASPTFTGTPSAPTATIGDNTTKIATTAFVSTAIGSPTPPGIIRSAVSDCLCALHADASIIKGSGMFASVTVVTGTDTSIPNSGTWTSTGGGCTVQPSGTLTGSGGNLATVTITNQGAGCTSNPTLVPSLGAIGTSTTAFSNCTNGTTDDTGSAQNFLTTWTQPANWWSATQNDTVTAGFKFIATATIPQLQIVWLEDAAIIWATNVFTLPATVSGTSGFPFSFTLAGGPGTNVLETIPGASPLYSLATAFNPTLTEALTWSSPHVLTASAKWSANTAGNAVCHFGLVVR